MIYKTVFREVKSIAIPGNSEREIVSNEYNSSWKLFNFLPVFVLKYTEFAEVKKEEEEEKQKPKAGFLLKD